MPRSGGADFNLRSGTLKRNRLFILGPSYAFQGGCGSIFHYFDYAKRQLEERTIDAAIVVCGNCIMSDCFLAVLSGMGLSASDGKCCSFDDKGTHRKTKERT